MELKEGMTVISLTQYNELRDFKREIEDGKIAVFSVGSRIRTFSYLGKHEALDELIDKLNRTVSYNSKLMGDIEKIKSEFEDFKRNQNPFFRFINRALRFPKSSGLLKASK